MQSEHPANRAAPFGGAYHIASRSVLGRGQMCARISAAIR